jgi:hypothetical protein
MAFDPNVKITPIKFGGLDETFDEKGSTFLALRKIQWCQEGNEPDETLAHLELRKWRVQNDGTERPDKGFAFLTPEGPHELARVLVHEGYGDTRDILRELRERVDFRESVEHINDEEPVGSGEYFDLRSMFEESAEEDEAS